MEDERTFERCASAWAGGENSSRACRRTPSRVHELYTTTLLNSQISFRVVRYLGQLQVS